jgi:hypothetical protein
MQAMDSRPPNLDQGRFDHGNPSPFPMDSRMRGYPIPNMRQPPLQDARFPVGHPNPGFEKRFGPPESKPYYSDRPGYGGGVPMHGRHFDEFAQTGGPQPGRPMFNGNIQLDHHKMNPSMDGPLGATSHRIPQNLGERDILDFSSNRAAQRGGSTGPTSGVGGGMLSDFHSPHLPSGATSTDRANTGVGGFARVDVAPGNFPEALNVPGSGVYPSQKEIRGPSTSTQVPSSGLQSGHTTAFSSAALHGISAQTQPAIRQSLDVPSQQLVVETLPIPSELASVASDPVFTDIMSRVKEQLQLQSLSFGRTADGVANSIVIDASSKEKATLAKNLLETHLKQQWKIKIAESRLQKIQTDLHSTQGEMLSRHMIEVVISADLVGLTIGKKGSRIKQIEAETGVTNINVGDNGHIVIYGSDLAAVQRAKEQLELKEEKVKLTAQQTDWIANKTNGNVVLELRSSASLMLAKFHYDSQCIEMIGTHQSVEMGKLLLTTQLEYIDKQIEIDNSERSAREKLQAVRKQFGMGGNWKNRSQPQNPQFVGQTTNQQDKQSIAQAESPLPPPPGLVPKISQVADQSKHKNAEDFLDALITNSDHARESTGPGKQKKQPIQQNNQQQQQTHKGQKFDKKAIKNEAFAFNEASPSVDLFQIAQASARMKAEHPQLDSVDVNKQKNKTNKLKGEQPQLQQHTMLKQQKPASQQQLPDSQQSLSQQQHNKKDKQKGKSGHKDAAPGTLSGKKSGRIVQAEPLDESSRSLPPPPTLTVPEGKLMLAELNEEEKKKQSRDKREKEKDRKKDIRGDDDNSKISQPKEPMLTKINLPFQKPSPSVEASAPPVIPIPPRSSGPPKDFSLLVIPPSGPPAKELSTIGNSPSNKDEEFKSSDEDYKKKSCKLRASDASTDEPITTTIIQDVVYDDETKAGSNSSLSPSAASSKKANEGTTRRLNVSKAAVMDSLMTVASDIAVVAKPTLKVSTSATANKDTNENSAEKVIPPEDK